MPTGPAPMTKTERAFAISSWSPMRVARAYSISAPGTGRIGAGWLDPVAITHFYHQPSPFLRDSQRRRPPWTPRTLCPGPHYPSLAPLPDSERSIDDAHPPERYYPELGGLSSFSPILGLLLLSRRRWGSMSNRVHQSGESCAFWVGWKIGRWRMNGLLQKLPSQSQLDNGSED
jgi:hypothetical protein